MIQTSHPRRIAAAILLLLAFSIRSSADAQSTRPDRKRAAQAYAAGARLIDHRDYPAAEQEFTRATALDPTRKDYALALSVARESHISALIQQAAKARLGGDGSGSDALLAEARALDPNNELVREHLEPALPETITVNQQTARDFRFAPPIQLLPAGPPQAFHARGDSRQVITQVATAFGIKVVFDDSAPSTPVRFDLESAPYQTAMPILLRMTHYFSVPVDSTTLLLAKDTQENRLRLERQLEETIFVPGSTQEQLNEILNVLKNIFDIRQIAIQPSAFVIRAPESTLRAVNYTVADLVDGGAQVLLQFRLYTLDKTRAQNLGTSTPTSVGAFSIASEAQSIVSANQAAIQQLISSGLFTPSGNAAKDIITEAIYLIASGVATDAKVSGLIALVGGGLTTAGIYTGSNPTINFALNSSEAHALDDITLRCGDRQQTTLRVGSKYPITTSTYSSGLSSSTSAALAGVKINGVSAQNLLNQYLGNGSNQTIPQIQYEDLGITLKALPTVQKSGLISIAIDLKIEALTGASNNNIPVLTSRAFQSSISVPEGATALMLSELSSTETAAVGGIPGLASLPGFQESLADKATERDRSELILLITPHVVRRRSSTLAGPRIAFQTNVPQD